MRTSFNMSDENITMVSGDTLSFNVIVKDKNGDPVTVSGATFKAKANIDAAAADISKSLGNGITQSDGVLTVRLAPADTANLQGFFLYDMDISVNSDRWTLLRGMLLIEVDVKGT